MRSGRQDVALSYRARSKGSGWHVEEAEEVKNSSVYCNGRLVTVA